MRSHVKKYFLASMVAFKASGCAIKPAKIDIGSYSRFGFGIKSPFEIVKFTFPTMGLFGSITTDYGWPIQFGAVCAIDYGVKWGTWDDWIYGHSFCGPIIRLQLEKWSLAVAIVKGYIGYIWHNPAEAIGFVFTAAGKLNEFAELFASFEFLCRNSEDENPPAISFLVGITRRVF